MTATNKAAVPDGWKLVPIESFSAMDDAGLLALPDNCTYADAERCYIAMLAAAPEATAQPAAAPLGGWISVNDRLPPSNQEVWASWNGAGNWNHDPKQGLARHVDSLGWQPMQSMGWDWKVTHWTPLPPAPGEPA